MWADRSQPSTAPTANENQAIRQRDRGRDSFLRRLARLGPLGEPTGRFVGMSERPVTIDRLSQESKRFVALAAVKCELGDEIRRVAAQDAAGRGSAEVALGFVQLSELVVNPTERRFGLGILRCAPQIRGGNLERLPQLAWSAWSAITRAN